MYFPHFFTPRKYNLCKTLIILMKDYYIIKYRNNINDDTDNQEFQDDDI